MTTLTPPTVDRHVATVVEPEHDSLTQRRCECPNDHTPERPEQRGGDDPHGRACTESARWWARVEYECDCIDVLALCSLCLDQWLDDAHTPATVLGQVNGPFRRKTWPGPESIEST